MACDLQGALAGQQKMKLPTKIWKFPKSELIYPDGDFVVGMAGIADEMMEVVDFFAHPDSWGKPPRMRQTSGLVLTKEGLFYFSNPVKWMRIQDKVYAIGSGGPTALGALHAGASPKDAILAATKVDPFTGMGTKVISL